MKGFLVMFSEAELQALHARKANGDIKSIGAFVRDAVMLHVERQGWVAIEAPTSDAKAVEQGKAVDLAVMNDVVAVVSPDVTVVEAVKAARKPQSRKASAPEMSELAQVHVEEPPRDISEISGEAPDVKVAPEENLFG